MWGKLAPGISAKISEQELRILTDELRRQHPDAVWTDEFIQSSPGGHLQVMQPEMYRVAAMVGVLTLLILTISCTNLGGLMMARAVTREHEIGIRVAIGAGRARIFRQLCTESLLLAAMGSLVGLVLACTALRVVLTKTDAPKWLSALPDWRVMIFTAGITAGTTLLFGLAPALQIARQRQRKTIARQILVGTQIAASSVLLIVAALNDQNWCAIWRIKLGLSLIGQIGRVNLQVISVSVPKRGEWDSNPLTDVKQRTW